MDASKSDEKGARTNRVEPPLNPPLPRGCAHLQQQQRDYNRNLFTELNILPCELTPYTMGTLAHTHTDSDFSFTHSFDFDLTVDHSLSFDSDFSVNHSLTIIIALLINSIHSLI